MCGFEFRNAHPHGLIGLGDCVKQAICHATGLPYMCVQRGLNRAKEITGAKTYNELRNAEAYIRAIGAKSVPIGKAWTVAQVVDKLATKGKNGSYIIDTKTHWTAAVIENGEGKIVDLWNPGKEIAIRVWEF